MDIAPFDYPRVVHRSKSGLKHNMFGGSLGTSLISKSSAPDPTLTKPPPIPPNRAAVLIFYQTSFAAHRISANLVMSHVFDVSNSNNDLFFTKRAAVLTTFAHVGLCPRKEESVREGFY